MIDINPEGMSAVQLLKAKALHFAELGSIDSSSDVEYPFAGVGVNNIDEVFKLATMGEYGEFFPKEIRYLDWVSTGLDSSVFDRNYDVEEVALEICGHWVGFPYWSRRDEHGEPNMMGFIEDAYFVECKEELKVVKTFCRVW